MQTEPIYLPLTQSTVRISDESTYSDGNRACCIFAQDTGVCLAKLSVNLPEHAHLLDANEFFLKTWSENEAILRDLWPWIAVDETRSIECGSFGCQAPIARLRTDAEGVEGD